MQRYWHVILIILALAAMPLVARAEGPTSGGTRVYVDDAELGAFTATVFAAPNPPVTTDRLWVTVEIRDNALAIANARVWVTVYDPKSGYTMREEATHDIAPTSFDYTAAIPVPEESEYEVTVEMEHETGNASLMYRVGVSEPLTNTIFLMMLGPALLIVVFLIHRFVVRLPASAAVLAGDDTPLREQ